MGNHITHALVGMWFDDWRRGGNLLALSPWVAPSALVGVIFVVAAFVWAGASLRQGLVDVVAHVERQWCTRGRTFMLAAGVTAIVLLAGTASLLAIRTPRSELLSSDPILAFLRTTVAVHDDRYLATVARLRQDEPQRRAAYPKGLPFDRKHVVVVTVDSLRADHMSLYGYGRSTTPFLDSLAADGGLRRVDFATSTCAESNCGILSTLFSKHLTRQIPEDFSLYTLLKDQGYRTYFVLSGNHDWLGLREMYGREQTVYFDGRDGTHGLEVSDDRVVFEGLDRVPDADAPSFFFVHLMSTHLLGTKLPEYGRFQPADVRQDWDALFRGSFDRASVVNNYDNGVLQADAMLRHLFETLDRKGYLANSVVVILSDHGEGLGERRAGGYGYGHVVSLYQEFIRIPLLIYDPTPFSYRNLTFATQIDVAPTVVERLGLPRPDGWEGTSLVSQDAPALSRHQTTLSSPCYAVLLREAGHIYKYLSCYLGRREEVYDLTADPGERMNIREQVDPALRARLEAAVMRMRTE